MHITGPLHHSSAQLRYEGFVHALRKNQLELRASDVYEGDYSQDAGYIGMKKLLSLDDYPKAVFVGNDLMSVGALQALGEANLRVPQDIAIVSFDDVYLAQLTSPPLTTVRQPIKELGKYAAEILINRLTDTNDQNTDIVPTQGLQHKLETKLIIRRSCGCMVVLDFPNDLVRYQNTLRRYMMRKSVYCVGVGAHIIMEQLVSQQKQF